MKELDRVESKTIEMLTAEFPSLEEQRKFFEFSKNPENKNAVLNMIANFIHKKVNFQIAMEDGVCLINDMEKTVKNVYKTIFINEEKEKNESIEEAEVIEETKECDNPKKKSIFRRLFRRKKS